MKDCFPLKSENKAWIFSLTTSIQYHTESPSQYNSQEKEIKGMQIGRQEVKLSLLADGMTAYTEDLKKKSPMKRLLQLNKFNKVVRYKVNIKN